MCGGNLEIPEGVSICECAYCGVRQTVPNADDEKKVNLFNRANHLRIMCAFDKAENIYENIIAEFPEEAEAYWGLVLCEYGIEYVDDPDTATKIPTCHRASFEIIEENENFQLAIKYADAQAQGIYRAEARKIDRIRKEILNISSKEEPYDVFICYKESDNGDRTIDSVIAYDIYERLADKGLNVFFSKVSLEDKLGKQYEPYIFAALNSAKVMIVIGTKPEFFEAVWVKNEWSRFLKLMGKDKMKTLIPCFKDMDAYDMPEEFKLLQGQDLGKLGAEQDIVRGVEKIINSYAPDNSSSYKKNTAQFNGGEDETLSPEKNNQKNYDYDYSSAEGYTNKKVIKILIPVLIAVIVAAALTITTSIPKTKYDEAVDMMNNGAFVEAYKAFEQLDDYKDSADKKYECQYRQASQAFDDGEYDTAREIFSEIKDYKDSNEMAEKSVFMKQKAAIAEAGIGDVVEFGEYEQDNDTDNGKEIIEWIVLDVSEGKALLVSKYALDSHKYNNQRVDTTWADSSIRRWLNDEFYQEAFASDYQSVIQSTSIYTYDNPNHGTAGGANTTDHVFLLSYEEADYYFTSNAERVATPTDYAKKQGVETLVANNCWWWLRTPGINSVDVCGVHNNGKMDDLGSFVNNKKAGVRPAIWVKTS